MLRLPTLLPLKPSTPTTGLNPTRRKHGRCPRRLLASPAPPPPRPPNPTPTSEPEPCTSRQNREASATAAFPTTKLRKPRRPRRVEAAAADLEGKGDILNKKEEEEQFSDEEERGEPGKEEGGGGGQKAVMEEEDPSWPLDADVGWGIRASEYFDKHSIKNVTVERVEIDWEREIDEGWVKEINCLEWESFAFHPSPLVVLVFERYNRAADNWKFLQELEKVPKVYWKSGMLKIAYLLGL